MTPDATINPRIPLSAPNSHKSSGTHAFLGLKLNFIDEKAADSLHEGDGGFFGLQA